MVLFLLLLFWFWLFQPFWRWPLLVQYFNSRLFLSPLGSATKTRSSYNAYEVIKYMTGEGFSSCVSGVEPRVEPGSSAPLLYPSLAQWSQLFWPLLPGLLCHVVIRHPCSLGLFVNSVTSPSSPEPSRPLQSPPNRLCFSSKFGTQRYLPCF